MTSADQCGKNTACVLQVYYVLLVVATNIIRSYRYCIYINDSIAVGQLVMHMVEL